MAETMVDRLTPLQLARIAAYRKLLSDCGVTQVASEVAYETLEVEPQPRVKIHGWNIKWVQGDTLYESSNWHTLEAALAYVTDRIVEGGVCGSCGHPIAVGYVSADLDVCDFLMVIDGANGEFIPSCKREV